MANFTYRNVSIENAATLDDAIRMAAIAFLRRIDHEPTQDEVDALIAEIQTEADQKVDFEGFVGQATSEIAWLDTTIPTITDPIVKRIAQENRGIIKALRFVARRLN